MSPVPTTIIIRKRTASTADTKTTSLVQQGILVREWDIERTLEANASTLAFTATMLAATIDRRWLALPAIVTGFLFQHAMQGWCPPLPILRRLGFRTAEEKNQERYALKALRGDFDAKGGNKLDTVLRAVGIRRGGA